jgi:hypothetical protein
VECGVLLWVTARLYEPGGVTGIVTTMLVCEKLSTVSEVVLSLTVGIVLPKFAPVMVILCVARLTLALLMTTELASIDPGRLASVRASTATMSVILECNLRVEFFTDAVVGFWS